MYDFNNKTNDEVYKTFCNSVKELCKDDFILYRDLSKEIGISEQSIQNKINHQNGRFNLIEMLRIAKLFNTTIEDLATGNL